MTTKKPLSESAQWFLEDFQRLQDDFAEIIGVLVETKDKEDNLITKRSGGQRICNLILASEEGKIRCRDAHKMISSLAKNENEPVFLDCYAGYVCLGVPIIIKGNTIGTIVSCGGRYDRGESKEKLTEKFSKLADELGIIDKENFLKAAIDEVELVTEEEVKKRAQRLAELIEILAETAVTPLKEVFG